jgi:V/A-type H+-transporting ATPase subunit E
MSNLENLVQKILDDAKKEADLIIEEANKKKEEIISSRIKEANEKKEKILEKASREADMIKDRIISNAELSARDERLKAKQQVMDRVFELAKERLRNLNEQDFIKFIKGKLESMALDGSEVLVLPEYMKEKVKSLGLPVIVSDESVESGFLIKTNNIVLNYSFDSLVDFLREELEGEIAAKLFRE